MQRKLAPLVIVLVALTARAVHLASSWEAPLGADTPSIRPMRRQLAERIKSDLHRA